eukprot:g8648.t2
MAFNAEGGSFGPSRRTHEYRADPYSLGAIRESAFNMASRIFRSVETWIRSEPNSDPLPWADRGSDPALDGLLRAQASPFGIRSRSDDKVDQEESQLKRPSPLQVEAGGLRMAGAPRGLPFRHPDTPCQSSLTARPVHHEITKGTLLGPLDEVLARYVQDRTGGSEGMHVFNFNAGALKKDVFRFLTCVRNKNIHHIRKTKMLLVYHLPMPDGIFCFLCHVSSSKDRLVTLTQRPMTRHALGASAVGFWLLIPLSCMLVDRRFQVSLMLILWSMMAFCLILCGSAKCSSPEHMQGESNLDEHYFSSILC